MTIPRFGRSSTPAARLCVHAQVAATLIVLLASTGAAAAPRPVAPHLVPIRAVAAPKSAHGLCERLSWACARSSARNTVASDGTLGLAQRINRAVNDEVRQISDFRQYGREDVWALPTARGGDCEDFVLEKKRRLIEAGLPAGALLIATVLDRHRKGHAVLVFRTRSQDFVLDNLTDRVLPWHRTGYSYLRMQNPRAQWNWDVIAAGGIFETAGGFATTDN